jgi:hypothetical protein
VVRPLNICLFKEVTIEKFHLYILFESSYKSNEHKK